MRPHKRRRIEENEGSYVSITHCIRSLYSPELPIVLSRLLLHTMGIIIVLLAIYRVLQSCLHEIHNRYDQEILQYHMKVAECNRNYLNNGCGPFLKGEYWQAFCEEWDICRQSEPLYIGRAKIATQVMGELLNGFIDPLSLKSMVC
ncbi:Di-sulfide bridge nucleocytoplasmic transport domain-containing protein [Pilobolus umbonatus]|nr:Di-sulfide bridge nucleocytoplasmic transport domain-containing protein [Pilobolus umbonatus]